MCNHLMRSIYSLDITVLFYFVLLFIIFIVKCVHYFNLTR